MGASEESLALLRRIATATEQLVHLFKQQPAASSSKPSGEVASEQDLDSQYGNPEVRKDPPRWKGERYAPCRMSDTCPEYLDELASFCDWKAGKAEEANEQTSKGKPLAPYHRKDAARARGWAQRMRSGWKPAQQSTPGPADDFNAMGDEPGAGW